MKRKEPEKFRSPKEFIPRFEEEPINLESIVDEIIEKNTTDLLAIQAGVHSSLDHLVTEVMRKSGGKADPHKIKHLILDKLAPRL